MRVLVTGLRGFPDVQGGVETHCEQLYPRLKALAGDDCEIVVTTRTPYWRGERPSAWQGIRYRPLWTPAHPKFEAIVHTVLATLYAGITRPDLVHVHAIGPALVVPLARLLGLRVIVTHHGADYDREKWGGFARRMLQLGERWGMRWSHARIVISRTIRRFVKETFQREADLIPNGVPPAERIETGDWLSARGIQPGRYILQVSRLVPEKRQLDLIAAFRDSHARAAGWHLLFAGGLDETDAYHQQLMQAAAGDEQILLTGFQTGDVLAELLSHAGCFVLPSSHEGLPIALLEALSYGRRVVASDIPANLEVELSAERYFPLGDVDALRERIDAAADRDWLAADAEGSLAIARRYDWDEIAQQTLDLYRRVIATGR
ncbi:MAG: glycosyltransferase family 4 protein [Pseudomonadota bacterium]